MHPLFDFGELENFGEFLRTRLIPTTGLEIVERGEKKRVGGTIGKEVEVKKKKEVRVDIATLKNLISS